MTVQEKLTAVVSDPSAVEIIEKVATKATYTASAGTVLFGLTADEWGAIGVLSGIALGAATFGFNAWFRMKYQRPDKKENCK